jgi:hypothetical protein
MLDGSTDDQLGRRHVIFGNREEFAVEAIVEPGPEFGPVQGRNIVGRLRVWIGGNEVGRIQEPACWLGPPCDDLVEMRDRLQTLWEDSFDGLSADETFDRLDYLCFGARRGQSLREAWTEEQWTAVIEEGRGYHRFVFLLNSSEAFDGWKAFLLRPTSHSLQALVSREPFHVVVATIFPVAIFTDAVTAFASWLSVQERLLLPRSPL